MALGPSAYLNNKLLDHTLGGVAYTPPTTLWVKLHTAAPGAAGATAAATNAVRKQGIFATSAASSTKANTTALSWAAGTEVTTTENYTNFSLWDASTGGNFLWSGDINPDVSVTSSGAFVLPIGSVVFDYTVAS